MKKFKFYMTPQERTGFLLLVFLVLLSHGGILIYEKIVNFTDKEKLEILNNILSDHTSNIDNNSSNDYKLPIGILKQFDPNKIDSELLLHYGISKYSAVNIEKYRKAGGIFSKRSDLLKIYGIDSINFYRIKSLIQLPETNKHEETLTAKAHANNFDSSTDPSIYMNPSNHLDPFISQIDPNNADKLSLIKLGLSSFAADNIINYVAKGGSFKSDSDLLKIYGIDTAKFQSFAQQLFIKPMDSIQINPNKLKSSEKPETDQMITQIVNINQANEASLRVVKGIGPYLSHAIVAYRTKLGGFHKLEQLKEVYAMRSETYDQIKDQLIVQGEIKKIYPPDLSFKEVLRHPYMDYESTKKVKNLPFTEFDRSIHLLLEDGSIDPRMKEYLHLSDPHSGQVE